MGKKVKVKYLKRADEFRQSISCRDMTVGNVYDAYIPDADEVDPHGLSVRSTDEIWIESDDSGDAVVTRILDVFEIVEG